MTTSTKHQFKPGKFQPDQCQVQLLRYQCPYPADEHPTQAPASTPCPECANGKCSNCVGTVPDGDDYDHQITCPCKAAGHEETP